MKKTILLPILAVCILLSGYAYARSNAKVPSFNQKEKQSNMLTSRNGQAGNPNNKIAAGNSKSTSVPGSSNKRSTDKTGGIKSNNRQAVKRKATYNISSVKVDISEQKVYVYNKSEMIKTMICSTGIENQDSKTPRGNFIINESGVKKGEWFYSNKYKEGAKYWVGFIGGTYLFHSVPMDINKTIIEEEASKLGTPASHGCIRLNLDDAYWFYKNIKSGTKLVIQD